MSDTTEWLKQLVNRHQTPEERRDKYLYLITSGVGWQQAQRARDWTWYHVELLVRNEKENPTGAELALQIRMLH